MSLKSKSKRYVLPSESKKTNAKCFYLDWYEGLNSLTILNSTLLSFFVSYNFADILDNETIFADCFECFNTPSTAIAGAKNAEFQLMFKKYIWLLFLIDFVEIYKNTTFDPR